MKTDDEKQIEAFYRIRAREFVDMLADKGFLAEDLSRESSRDVENLLGYMFQVQCEGAVKCSELVKKVKNKA